MPEAQLRAELEDMRRQYGEVHELLATLRRHQAEKAEAFEAVKRESLDLKASAGMRSTFDALTNGWRTGAPGTAKCAQPRGRRLRLRRG